jgi:hypothetical protein
VEPDNRRAVPELASGRPDGDVCGEVREVRLTIAGTPVSGGLAERYPDSGSQVGIERDKIRFAISALSCQGGIR